VLTKVIAFALAVTPIMLTPGVSATLVTRRVIDQGRGGGFQVAAGTACGLMVHATAAVLGLAALVSESATAFTMLKLVGAAYLIVLGVSALRAARRDCDRPQVPRFPWSTRSALVEALLANVLNPRAASVYLTLVPQFISPGDNVVAVTVSLLTVHIAMQTAWLSIWTLLVARAHRALRSDHIRRFTDWLAGTVLVGLGARTALRCRAP
jgi:threonine/homoserine/homoserine lactone efflux protein